jgi:hypothetical protein
MPSIVIRLYQFPPKNSPVPADIVYLGDSANSFNEVQATIAQVIGAYPPLLGIGGLTLGANTFAYVNGSAVYTAGAITAYGLTLTGATDISDALTALGIGSATNGQIPIGTTSTGLLTLGTLTAGTNISVSNTAGAITISATGLAGIGWTNVTGTTQAMTADNGYVADSGSLCTMTLPTTAAFGTIIYVQGLGAGGWSVAQNAGQQIIMGTAVTTSGAGGSLSSTNQYDAVALLCVTANTTWTVMSSIGNPLLT